MRFLHHVGFWFSRKYHLSSKYLAKAKSFLFSSVVKLWLHWSAFLYWIPYLSRLFLRRIIQLVCHYMNESVYWVKIREMSLGLINFVNYFWIRFIIIRVFLIDNFEVTENNNSNDLSFTTSHSRLGYSN